MLNSLFLQYLIVLVFLKSFIYITPSTYQQIPLYICMHRHAQVYINVWSRSEEGIQWILGDLIFTGFKWLIRLFPCQSLVCKCTPFLLTRPIASHSMPCLYFMKTHGLRRQYVCVIGGLSTEAFIKGAQQNYVHGLLVLVCKCIGIHICIYLHLCVCESSVHFRKTRNI